MVVKPSHPDSHLDKGCLCTLHMPGAKNTKAYKLVHQYNGSFQVVAVYETGIDVKPMNRPNAEPS